MKLVCPKCGGEKFFNIQVAEYAVESGKINREPINPQDVFVCLQDGSVITGVEQPDKGTEYLLVSEQSGRISREVPDLTPHEIQKLSKNGLLEKGDTNYITEAYLEKYHVGKYTDMRKEKQ